MRIELILAVVLSLSLTTAAHAELPLTYVGSPEMHRVDGAVSQVTLAQPYLRDASVLRGRLSHSSLRNPDCVIETSTFLQEPASEQTLFSDKLMDSAGAEPEYEEHRQAIHQNLDAPVSKRGKLLPHPIDPKNFDQRSGSPFDGMLLSRQ